MYDTCSHSHMLVNQTEGKPGGNLHTHTSLSIRKHDYLEVTWTECSETDRKKDGVAEDDSITVSEEESRNRQLSLPSLFLAYQR